MMTTATDRLAALDEAALIEIHQRLDRIGPVDDTIVHTHHLVTTEMASRGVQHGHGEDQWREAVVLIDSEDVDGPDAIDAPDVFEKAWADVLADGGTVSVLLTVDGYVLKADPGVSDVHVDAIMPGKKKKPPMVDEDTTDQKPGSVSKSIIEEGGKFTVTSRDWSRRLGTYDTMDEERKRLAQVEGFAKGFDPEEMLSDRDRALYDSLEQVVEQFGDFSLDDAHYMPADDNPFSGKGMVCANCVFYDGGGGCEILQDQVEPLALCKFWIIDSSLRKAHDPEPVASPVSRLTLPDGTVYEQASMVVQGGGGGGVFFKGSRSDAGRYAANVRWHGQGSFAGADLSPEADKFIRANLSRGNLVESYGLSYDTGKSARQFGEDHVHRVVADRIAKRDSVLSKYMGQDRSHATEAAAFGAATHQGFIDGALGRKAKYARNHSFGEMMSGLFGAGLSGAMKSLEFSKHQAGKHDQSTHGRWANGGASRAGSAGTGASEVSGGIRPDVRQSIEAGIAFGRGPDAKGRDVAPPPQTVDEFRKATEDAVAHRDPNRQIMRPGGKDPRYPDKPDTVVINDGLEDIELNSSQSLWHVLVPDGKGGWIIDPERQKLHDQIADAMIAGPPPPGRKAPSAPGRPVAVFLGGGPAAGKTTMERSSSSGIPDGDSRVTIAPDHAKFALPEYADMVSEGPAGADAAAGFVHEESSLIAKRAQAKAEEAGQSMVIDGLGDSGVKKLSAKVDHLRSRGYDVVGRYATVSTEEAVRRAASRAKRTGFTVRESAVRDGHRRVSAIAPDLPSVYDNIEVYFTDTPDNKPVLIAKASGGSDWTVVDPGQFDAFLEKGKVPVVKAAEPEGENWLRSLADGAAMEGLGDVPFEAGIDSEDSPYLMAMYSDWADLMRRSREAAQERMGRQSESPTLLSKAVDEKRFTLGPMYVPDRLDAHAEWTDVDELQKAVWEYVKKGDRRIRLQHNREVVAGEFVEIMAWPYEVEVPMMMKDASVKPVAFPANTVFLGVQWSPWAWELVKSGKLRGYSIGGRAQRLYVDLPEA